MFSGQPLVFLCTNASDLTRVIRWVKRIITKNYHMVVCISNPLSALGPVISAREHVGSRADIKSKD